MGSALIWLLRRGGYYLVAAWVALTLNFAVPRLMPGDPATLLFGRMQGDLEPEALDALREAFGLTDDWLVVQYFKFGRWDEDAVVIGGFGRRDGVIPSHFCRIRAQRAQGRLVARGLWGCPGFQLVRGWTASGKSTEGSHRRCRMDHALAGRGDRREAGGEAPIRGHI